MHNSIQITKLGAMLQEEGRLFNYNSLPSTLPFYLLTYLLVLHKNAKWLK